LAFLLIFTHDRNAVIFFRPQIIRTERVDDVVFEVNPNTSADTLE